MPRQVLGIAHTNLIIPAMKDNQETGGYRFNCSPHEVEGPSEWDTIKCFLATEEMRGCFQVQQMPGCCAVLVLSYIKVNPSTQENVDEVIKIVEQAAYDAGFGSVMMTQVVPAYSKMLWKKEPWIRCLDRGWTYNDPFRNAKSGNLCVYLSKDMNQPHERPEREQTLYTEQL